MAIGKSLHLGLNRVDPAHYGSDMPLVGCHNDANEMALLAEARGYVPSVLLDEDATVEATLGELESAARDLQPGDAFLLSGSCHGTQAHSIGGELDDEPDNFDEVWCLFDRMLVDDEIYLALSRFRAGVRVLVLSDSCFSGTITRSARSLAAAAHAQPRSAGSASAGFRLLDARFNAQLKELHGPRYQEIRREARQARDAGEIVKSAVIQISACQDTQLAADGLPNGLFTSTLLQTWAGGTFAGGHRQLWKAIHAATEPAGQSPNFVVLGEDTDTFELQVPFTI